MPTSVEQAAEVLVRHPVIPDYKAPKPYQFHYCPVCRIEINGSCNSPGHAQHQAQVLADAKLLISDEQAFVNGLPLEDKVNHQHSQFAARVAHAVVADRDFPWTEPAAMKSDAQEIAVKAISAAFAQLWAADVINPDALVAFLNKEVA